MQDVFRALADPTRRAMLELLSRRSRTAAELAAPFAMTRAAASQHLGVLLDAGLVDMEPVGRNRVYRLRRSALRPAVEWLASQCEAAKIE